MRLKLLALFTYAVLLAASSIPLRQDILPIPITWDTMPSHVVAYSSKEVRTLMSKRVDNV